MQHTLSKGHTQYILAFQNVLGFECQALPFQLAHGKRQSMVKVDVFWQTATRLKSVVSVAQR